MNHREWCHQAIQRIEADFQRSADTHLLRLELKGFPGIEIYFKDESAHPTGSLKHRLARSLFLYALCNGWVGPETTLIEASSGSTAVSEAYFAQLIGLPFIAVVPSGTSKEKIQQIEFYGGKVHFVSDAMEACQVSEELAQKLGGHFMDQFTYAERATDWRGNNNIAESIFEQMSLEAFPIPEWIICGAGTGGTSATLGRYVRFQKHRTQVAVVDPEGSVFEEFHRTRNRETIRVPCKIRIEGIGRPRVEPSFIPDVIDRVIPVSDALSIAAARKLSKLLGRQVGGSTGTNFYGTLLLAEEMRKQNRKGSLVTLICDAGARYASTYFSDAWVQEQGLKLEAGDAFFDRFGI